MPFSFCLDAAGNLVRIVDAESPDALITDAVEVVTPASELLYPYPWTFTVEAAVQEIQFLPAAMVKGTSAESIHTSGTLPVSEYVFVPRSTDFASDEQIMEIIDLLSMLTLDDEKRAKLVSALQSVGVVEIPPLTTFSTGLHKPLAPAEQPIECTGWLSHTKVYRMATFND